MVKEITERKPGPSGPRAGQ